MAEPLTMSEHESLGRELHKMYDRLTTISVEIANAYPKSSTAARRAYSAHKQLAALRCVLDDQLALDHPGDFDPRVYYPGAA
jgi:hypothetical protein